MEDEPVDKAKQIVNEEAYLARLHAGAVHMSDGMALAETLAKIERAEKRIAKLKEAT